jgi:hypothetical protein
MKRKDFNVLTNIGLFGKKRAISALSFPVKSGR